MFKKVLDYAGAYRRLTYRSVAVLLLGVAMSVLPYWFAYQLILPLLGQSELDAAGIFWRVGAIAVCGVLYALLYVHGLELSHRSAYHTLENIRVSLQRKLEQQPLGAIQEKGVGVLKKTFIDDIESIELLLTHAIPEGISNIAVPVLVFTAMFFADWKLAPLSLCSLPLGFIAMGAMYRQGTSKMGAYYGAAQKMNSTIAEYINGMEVVKVFDWDGDSYQRFEADVKNYRDFTLDWYKACWPWLGGSGSGKSTLAKLLVHFYDVTGGAVKIGGQDVRDMSIEALNNEISYVSQEQFLFNMSLLENIRLGRLDATDEEVLAAAEKAQCGEFLARLPQGPPTMAGDGGRQLSGGERQRISLAGQF